MSKELVFIGLGRMGSAMATLLTERGFTVHAYNRNYEAAQAYASDTLRVYETLESALTTILAPRTVWLMVSSSAVDEVLAQILPTLQPGDTVIDGGNSFYQESLRRHAELKAKQINFIDCGVSGGMEGARNGASVMVGGETEIVEHHRELFEALAIPKGFGHVGGPGAGHYVKMIHNGIEYGMMGALAEGLSTIERHQAEFTINIPEVLTAYEHGSIITSSLMNWLGEAYRTPGYLEHIAGMVPKGETEFEMEHIVAHEESDVLRAALTQRKKTREVPSRIGTLISAMRNQFGGHKTINTDGN